MTTFLAFDGDACTTIRITHTPFWNDRCLIEAVSDLKHKKVIQSLALFMFIISKPLRK